MAQLAVPLVAASLIYACSVSTPFRRRRYLVKGSTVVSITGGLGGVGVPPAEGPEPQMRYVLPGGSPCGSRSPESGPARVHRHRAPPGPTPLPAPSPGGVANPRGRPPRSCPRASTEQAAVTEEWAQHWGSDAAAGTALFPIQTRCIRYSGAGPSPASACRICCRCSTRPPRVSSSDTPHGLGPQACRIRINKTF
jgi:hypothetical protein